MVCGPVPECNCRRGKRIIQAEFLSRFVRYAVCPRSRSQGKAGGRFQVPLEVAKQEIRQIWPMGHNALGYSHAQALLKGRRVA